jgi:hypothetical protein
MATALEVIVRAYKALTVVGSVSSATSPTTEQRNDGLTALNSLLDSLNNENLTCYSVRDSSFTLSIGVSSYTVGSGATVNITRPLQVIQAYLQDSGGNNYPLTIRTRDQWNNIGNRSSIITSQIPTDCFYDPTYPNGVFAVFPYPLAAYTVFFDSYAPLVSLSTLTESLAFPPGYERMMVYNLAAEIATANGIVNDVVPQVMELASKSMAAIKRTNMGNREIVAQYDGAIVSRAYPTYNIYSDR